jgi:hypothetical protein
MMGLSPIARRLKAKKPPGEINILARSGRFCQISGRGRPGFSFIVALLVIRLEFVQPNFFERFEILGIIVPAILPFENIDDFKRKLFSSESGKILLELSVPMSAVFQLKPLTVDDPMDIQAAADKHFSRGPMADFINPHGLRIVLELLFQYFYIEHRHLGSLLVDFKVGDERRILSYHEDRVVGGIRGRFIPLSIVIITILLDGRRCRSQRGGSPAAATRRLKTAAQSKISTASEIPAPNKASLG